MSIGLPHETLPADVCVDDPQAMLLKLEQSVGHIPADKINQIRSEATLAHASISVLEDRVSYLDNTLHNIASDLNNTEVWLKEWNLLIHGLLDIPARPTNIEERNVYEFHFIEYVCAKLNELIGHKLYRMLHPTDFERAHILFQGAKATKPVVVVRFVRRVVRNNVFFNRKWLKGSKIAITDHLSKLNRDLFREAKDLFGPENTWTTFGIVKVRVQGRTEYIRSYADLERWSGYFQHRRNNGFNSTHKPNTFAAYQVNNGNAPLSNNMQGQGQQATPPAETSHPNAETISDQKQVGQVPLAEKSPNKSSDSVPATAKKNGVHRQNKNSPQGTGGANKLKNKTANAIKNK